jgi:hypothetical protein
VHILYKLTFERIRAFLRKMSSRSPLMTRRTSCLLCPRRRTISLIGTLSFANA